jgi:hypothetical protein
MTKAINLIQGVTTPEQINRVVDWNKERNGFELNSDLEVDMLREEVVEYFDAEEYVDRVDAVCDIIFVAIGTISKATYAFHMASEELLSPVDFVLTDFVGRTQAEGIDLELLVPLISECLSVVIEANEQKGTEKDENGKVKKPEGFVPPEETIAKIIESYKNAASEDQVDAMFEQTGML